jgi:two-component system, LytTR family, response regulator AlgR
VSLALGTEAPLRVLIVDDEPLARLRLRQLVQACSDPPVQVVGEAGHARACVEFLAGEDVDAVLLDIRMPGDDGLALAAVLRQRPRPPAIVFVTAHEGHALQAFELEALDYLTKPVQRERLQQALRRVQGWRAGAAAQPSAPAVGAWTAPARTQPPVAAADVLVIHDRQRVLRIPLAEIVLARASQKRVTITTLTREHVIDESLAELEQRLGDGLLRVHRSTLVARHAVRELQLRAPGATPDEGWAVRLMPADLWVPVSRRLLPAVRQILGH